MDGGRQDVANAWYQTAQRLWLSRPATSLPPAILNDSIWTPLQAEAFSLSTLTYLEGLQILEKLLWPTYNDDVSNQHILLIATFANVKQRARLQHWDTYADRTDAFSSLFRRILSLTLDQSLPFDQKLTLLSFVSSAVQSLDKDFIRKECAPLVSIAIWHNIHKVGARERLLDTRPGARKAWRAAQQRFEAADEPLRQRLIFDRGWLYSLLLDFFSILGSDGNLGANEIVYVERFIELLTDLLGQLPTRRYTLPLLLDLNLLPVLRSSKLYQRQRAGNLSELVELLTHFVVHHVSESQDQSNDESSWQEQTVAFYRLQRAAVKLFPEKLKVLALSNYSSASTTTDLKAHLATLTRMELEQFSDALDVRRSYPQIAKVEPNTNLLLECIVENYARLDTRSSLSEAQVLPTETILYDEKLLRNESYDGTTPLSLPKLNLQYLDLNDFFWRSFVLHRNEAFYEIRKDMESTLRRLKPRPSRDRTSIEFDGFSKMALPIENPGIVEVEPPHVGQSVPSSVRAEIILDVRRLNDGLRHEWDSLRPGDTVFLASVRGKALDKFQTNGHRPNATEDVWELQYLRTAVVAQLLDDNGRPVREHQNALTNGHAARPIRRRLILHLDTNAYKRDTGNVPPSKIDVYSTLNVLVRRNRRENNFKPVLETIQKLLNTKTGLPGWLQDVYLGYGNARHASYPNEDFRLEQPLDFADSFIDEQHLRESFDHNQLVPANGGSLPSTPPFVLKFETGHTSELSSNPKKRRRAQLEEDPTSSIAKVSTYAPPYNGPYPTDQPNVNKIRFTSNQVAALVSGVHPGLTVIVGPPGTGKTDVAAQLIHLLISNFPKERILLIAHSNQALNQLFQKIMALDIDPRHLLRLGHGEEGLETEESYSKLGRVESFLEKRQTYLAEVDRLARSIGAQGAHGSTCETADYFRQVYVESLWAQFWATTESTSTNTDLIRASFPFYTYFANAPVPELLPSDATKDELIEIARGCQRHIAKIFTELATVRPFEILRHSRDQQNHLLVKEARVIAMTSTHAAMRRSEVADLGFHYDTLIMEEAAQVTEIESFIPCAMQTADPKTGELPLKRVVLVGDHYQNSPVVANMALKHYSNYNQSLFLRLVRLGVPTIHLDQQGRCRPSIANLFRWRYASLGDLPTTHQSPEFSLANAGFRYDYQFIDVPDYQGEGERQPTPHFIQNLGEAEYVVALYQYMRLLDYPAKSISILATYAGQRALIRDVLEHRCKGNRLFGLPKIVSTVDKYQGEQNDYVIVSMTRSKGIGYLRDVRRLTVLLSRARLGLYVLGRKELFQTECLELAPAMQLFDQRPEKLSLVTGEMHPTRRELTTNVPATEMEGVEHLGQYVYEMTQAKVQALGGNVQMTRTEMEVETYGDEAMEGDLDATILVNGGQEEDDPLHEGV